MVIYFSKNQSSRWSQKMNKKCKSNFYWIIFILRFQSSIVTRYQGSI